MPDKSRGSRAALAALIAAGSVVAGVLGWRWFRSAEEPADEAVVLALSKVGVTPTQADQAPRPASVPAQLAASAADASVDPSCPPEWRALAGKPPDAQEQVFQRLRPQTLAHASQLLAASSDPFERVAGRLLAARARDQEQPPDADTYLALVSEALAGSDPRIAALAIQLCGAVPPEQAPACSSISPARWASVDPDNVQAWLAVASDALDRDDPRAAREALARAAQSSSSRVPWSMLMQLPGLPSLQGLSTVERQVLGFDMISVTGLLNNNGMSAAMRLCSADSAAAPARRDECSALASVLIDHGETLLDHGIGIGLGRRVGWPAERIDELERERDALREAYAAELDWGGGGDDKKGPMSVAEACDAYRSSEAVLSLVRSGNEMQLARRALQRRGAASAAGP